MGAQDAPLKGFSWQNGVDRVTTGIVMWSDIFLHTMQNTGEKIAILVIDTQGLFDDRSTTEENFKLFALGSLLSSIQVLNLLIQIQEDQLQYLHFATDFAKYIGNDSISSTSSRKPFQKLTFLIRDFKNPNQFPFGIDGGKKYIENRILNNKQSTQNSEIQSVRQHIKNTFEEIDCCLMPRPGDTVCEDDSYDGRLSGMSDRFKDILKNVIEYLLMPNNLVIKQINGQKITGAEMNGYINTYFTLIQSNNIEIKSFAEGTIDNYMNNLVNKCASEYDFAKTKYEDIKEDDNILEMHKNCKNKVLYIYDNEVKMGTRDHELKFRNRLTEIVKMKFFQWKIQMVTIAKEKKQTFEAEEAKEEEKKARMAAEKDLQEMKILMAIQCATSVLNTGISALSRSGNTPLIIPTGSSNMMPNIFDMMSSWRNKTNEEKANNEKKATKKVFEKFLNMNLDDTDESDDE